MTEFYPVRKLALEARAQLAVELLAQEIGSKISKKGERSYELASAERVVVFTAEKCEVDTDRGSGDGSDIGLKLIGPIILHEYDRATGALMHRRYSDRGIIRLEGYEGPYRMEVVLERPQWVRSDGITGTAERYIVRGVIFPETVWSKVGLEGLLETLDSAEVLLGTSGTEKLAELLYKVRAKIELTRNEITAETHSRLVFGVGCITLILISIALGILFRGGHLLSAFGTSSIPAGILIVCIMAGKDLTKNPSTPPITGVVVMWGGLVVLSIVGIFIYRRLLRT